MNVTVLPAAFLTLPSECGGIFLTVFLITLMIAFPLRMESRRSK